MSALACARTIVDEWARAGVTHAVVAPGSRSTPLALAVHERLDTHVILDERAASFTALGLSLANGHPTVVVCTSGTAATHFHAAVVEASQACVPLIVCTADRPPELTDVGAPQSIDQNRLYGAAVRWFAAPGVPDAAGASSWRSLAARAVCQATGERPGPVHLNLAFREPLLDDLDAEAAPGRDGAAPWHQVAAPPARLDPPAEVADLCARARRPVVVTGHLAPATLTLDGVPVLADHRGPLVGNVAHGDLLVRDAAFAAAHVPDLVIRAGMACASRPLQEWLAGLDAPQLALVPPGRWLDPSHTASWVLPGPVALELQGEPGWLDSWTTAAGTAAVAIDSALAGHEELTEPFVAREVVAARPGGSTLVVASSMPIRDVEAFGAPRSDLRVLANRGANGIDGLVSTALGVALTGAPTTLMIGDLALLHDVGALTGLARRGVDLTIVVVDNDGGGIFSLLSQRAELDDATFEDLFGTPQHVDLAALFGVHDIPAVVTTSAAAFAAALDDATALSGVRAVIAHTDRSANIAVHVELAGAVSRAVRPAIG